VTTPDPDTTSNGRRPLLIAAVVGGALVLAVVLALLLRDDSSDTDTAGGTTTTTTSMPDATTAAGDAAVEAGDATDGGDAATEEQLPVALTPVEGTTEAELCDAIVVRLGDYRDVVADELPTQDLLDAIDEFEAQVDTQSDDQDWGDRIVEQLTNVRREWATSLAAQRDGDEAAAQEHADAALGHLDRAIDDAGCPTA
jgi:hypothetical protein